MPQSLSKVIIHIIFSTKDREPWLGHNIRARMHAYVATICRDLNAEAFLVGGVADHLHVVTTLPRTLSQAAIIEAMKKTSSKWIKSLSPKYRGFYWHELLEILVIALAATLCGATVSLGRSSSTWKVRKRTIAGGVFKRSIEISWRSTASSSTSGTFGIDP